MPCLIACFLAISRSRQRSGRRRHRALARSLVAARRRAERSRDCSSGLRVESWLRLSGRIRFVVVEALEIRGEIVRYRNPRSRPNVTMQALVVDPRSTSPSTVIRRAAPARLQRCHHRLRLDDSIACVVEPFVTDMIRTTRDAAIVRGYRRVALCQTISALDRTTLAVRELDSLSQSDCQPSCRADAVSSLDPHVSEVAATLALKLRRVRRRGRRPSRRSARRAAGCGQPARA